jgi:hypothetical protein
MQIEIASDVTGNREARTIQSLALDIELGEREV